MAHLALKCLHGGRRLVLALGTAAPLWVAAAGKEEGGGNGASEVISLVTLGLGLLAVIAIIFGCAWIVRRMTGMGGVNNQAIKVVSVMALGARERIALIEVGGTQILVGITASAIRTLHVFDEPVVTPSEGGDSDFSRRLQGMIGRQWKPPKTSGGSDGSSS
ncbi:MAG: flagellar biosynthetic protein FliO [Oleiphilaceae bacterium]|nr:flagellar biosynthetic protein FliO [Oleiphilaceae bacterium]